MKTTSLKISVCAAALALLAITRAQTDNNGQTPDNSGNQNQQPPVIYVPVPVDSSTYSNANGNANADNGAVPQPTDSGNQPPGAQVIQPGQSMTVQPGQSVTQPGQYGNPNMNRYQNYQNRYQQGQGRNFERGQRRFGRDSRNSGEMQPLSANTDASEYTPPTEAGTNGTGDLYINFRNAPIDEVLNYLSDAAGFIIELDTQVRGTVDVWSAKPVNKDEAVQMLNSVLSRNGYALVPEGRVLRVMRYEDAVHTAPVIVTTNIYDIPKSAEVVTQIIPVRYVPARQLLTDLSPLISPTATILANEAGNSIIVTDSEENIRHLAEIIQDIDSSAEDVTELQVFPLRYHDPTEVANMINQVFSDQSNGQNGGGQTPIRFGGGGGGRGFGRFFGGGGPGGGGGFPGFGGAAAGGNQNDRIRQHAHVAAVADPRTQSVLVTAPKDMMDEIRQMIDGIDHESPKVASVTVIPINNADPIQVQKALQDYAVSTARNTGTTAQSALINRENQNASSTSTSSFGSGGTGFGGGGFGGGGFGGGGGGFGGGGFGGGGFRGGGQ